MIAPALCVVIRLSTQTGCVSARYKMSDKNTAPARPLNLTATQRLMEATVQSVVVYRGSGSWESDVFWDECRISLINCGDEARILETVSLVDFRGDTTPPGDNPWLIEKQNLTFQQEGNHTAKEVLVQTGSGCLAVGVAGSAMFLGGMACGTAGTVMFAGVLPVYAGGALYANFTNRHRIEQEFQRRRLILPQIIAPGQTVQDSLFFRISPGPLHLVFHGRSGGEPCDVTIDLTPLGPLHLTPALAPRPD